MITKRTIYILGLVTLIGFTLLGELIVVQYLDWPWYKIYEDGHSFLLQIAVGLAYGLLAGLFAWWIVKREFLAEVREYFSKMIGKINLNIWDILFISFCAGVGEEILFRGAIQPVFGIWITAIAFIILHGYLNPRNWRISVYGGSMCFVIAGLGYMAKHLGLFSAMSAHFMIDVVLLYVMNKEQVNQERVSSEGLIEGAFGDGEGDV